MVLFSRHSSFRLFRVDRKRKLKLATSSTVLKACPLPLLIPGALFVRRCVLVTLFVIGAILLSLSTSSVSAASTAPSSVIACFHTGIGRFSAELHPQRCDIRGRQGKRVIGIPVKGMKWGHWGARATRAAFGVEMRNGARVRVIAHRPVHCLDGRTWYSKANIVFLSSGDWLELQLPTCGT